MCLVGTWQGVVDIFNMTTQTAVTTIKEHSSAIEGIAINRLNIITGSLDKKLKSMSQEHCLFAILLTVVWQFGLSTG